MPYPHGEAVPAGRSSGGLGASPGLHPTFPGAQASVLGGSPVTPPCPAPTHRIGKSRGLCRRRARSWDVMKSPTGSPAPRPYSLRGRQNSPKTSSNPITLLLKPPGPPRTPSPNAEVLPALWPPRKAPARCALSAPPGPPLVRVPRAFAAAAPTPRRAGLVPRSCAAER